ncbi:MAG: hypothetical protein SV062_07420 [Thermodesulfobacteriota bacterium]|nr:hypothetical protein [Thermodesulfobacteriota bacterium]
MNYPSVTKVLSPYQDFSKVPKNRLENATYRGREIHKICAAIALDLWIPSIPEEYQGYIESFKRWFAMVDRVHYVETEFKHRVYLYCGHPDLIITMKGDSGISLCDIKTPIALNKAWQLQLAAYANLLKINKVKISKVFSLRLDPDGKVPKADIYTESDQDFNIFLSALNVYRFLNS